MSWDLLAAVGGVVVILAIARYFGLAGGSLKLQPTVPSGPLEHVGQGWTT